MLVRERMTSNPVTVGPETSFQDALQLLREKKIRRLPVVDKSGRLVGIVVEKDLLYASPSPASSLSVFEMHYLLAKLLVKDVMTKSVITVGEDCPLEEAARIMVDKRIGSLPIVRDRKIIGIITETDIFRTMAEALGGRAKGVRLTICVPEKRGEAALMTSEVAKLGGNIVGLALFFANDLQHREFTMKVEGVQRDALVSALEKAGAQIVDARDVTTEYQPQVITEVKDLHL
jgi:acetoin utilization protein AcuB